LSEASEGVMKWSESVVIVEIKFIDKSDGCCYRWSRVTTVERARLGLQIAVPRS
jgi:hypothetical protein